MTGLLIRKEFLNTKFDSIILLNPYFTVFLAVVVAGLVFKFLFKVALNLLRGEGSHVRWCDFCNNRTFIAQYHLLDRVNAD